MEVEKNATVVCIDNLISSGGLLLTLSKSVNSSLRYFLRSLIFKNIALIFISVFDFQNHRFDIFIGI